MSVVKLSLEEMKEMPYGARAISLVNKGVIKVGEDLVRGHPQAYCDRSNADIASAAFSLTDQSDYEYFKEGEVGVHVLVEQTHTACGTICDFNGLGIYRPDLETRKAGKVRVELVDDGFPLALREVAKVMTWAQTAKGYKDHDWQNLPNAEVALAAAASRHRTDHIMQRVVDGLLIERCVDKESGLLHKAHEAFGVLAQLELMLRGDFDLHA